MKYLVIALLLAVTVGCGGGQMAAPQAPAPVPVSMPPAPPPPAPEPPPAPPPPSTIPVAWTVTELMPLPGYLNSQANAINGAGVVAGYSVDAEGNAEATLWANGASIDLGPGYANAVNDRNQVVGYSPEPDGTLTAHLWFNGTDTIMGEWIPLGINNAGVVVGDSLVVVPAQQWDVMNGQRDVPGCQTAFAINDAGVIAGIAPNGNATVCGDADYGVLGAAVAINSVGVTVGNADPDAASAIATEWPSTQIAAANSLATGINDDGWVVGETIEGGGGNVVDMARARMAGSGRLGVVGRLSGQSHPFAWTAAEGLIQLPAPLVTAEDIKGQRIVGAGVAPDGTIHGFMLEGR